MTEAEATQLLAFISEDPVRAQARLDGPLMPPPTLIRATQHREPEADVDADALKPRFLELAGAHGAVERFVENEPCPFCVFSSHKELKTG